MDTWFWLYTRSNYTWQITLCSVYSCHVWRSRTSVATTWLTINNQWLIFYTSASICLVICVWRWFIFNLDIKNISHAINDCKVLFQWNLAVPIIIQECSPTTVYIECLDAVGQGTVKINKFCRKSDKRVDSVFEIKTTVAHIIHVKPLYISCVIY